MLAKVVLIGDGFVGKTSLRDRYSSDKFTSEYLPTLGSDFIGKKVLIKTRLGWKEIYFQIWDLAGQPTYKQIRSMYYKRASGAILVFDVTIPESLYNLENWLEELAKNVLTPKVSICILGNKIDIRSETSVSMETAKETISKKINPKFKNLDRNMVYIETSAKTGENVERAFQALGEKILNTQQSQLKKI